ncbi:ABC transporter substrate-binding protein [bacterium]|nr:MAG: ABC transporter substrate-binding protein [bacterium]
MMPKLPMRLFMSAAAAFLLYSACSREPARIPVIRVACAPHDHHAALYVAALSPEYFQENGNLYLQEKTFKKDYDLIEGGTVIAHVTLDSSGGDSQNVRKLCEDQFDFAFGSFPEMVRAVDEGRPVKVVAPITTGGTGLVVSADMCARSWKEFVALARWREKPLRIGYKTEGSNQQGALGAALWREGIPSGKWLENSSARVLMINLYGQNNLIPAVKAGLVDGFVGMQPLLAEAQFAGAGKIIAYIGDFETAGGEGYFPCCALGAREEFISRNPGQAEKFLTLVLRANRYVSQNPGKIAQKVAKWLEKPVEIEEMSLPTIKYSTDFKDGWKESADAWLRDAIEKRELVGAVRKAYEEGETWQKVFDLPLLDKASKKL